MDLQKYLNANGAQLASSGAGSPGNETEFFGELTRAGLAKWQAANGVSPTTGYFGPITRAKMSSIVYSNKSLSPRGDIKIVIIEFILADDPKMDWFYEFYCNADDCIFRTPDQNTKYFTDWCGSNCQINKKSFFEVFNNLEGTTNIYSINKNKVKSYYSIYQLKEFYENEAKKYGVDLNINLDIFGPYNLSSKPPQRLRDGSPAALETFFDNEAQKHNIDIAGYDIVNYLYFTNENYFVSTVSGKKTFNQASISFDEFFNNIIVIVHEMGHIFGARDTYEPGSWVCEYPKGYPEPNKTPLYPQSRACLMCKFIVVDEKTFVASRSFSELTTCDEEAKAFGWK